MEELIVAIVSGFVAGAILGKLSRRAQNKAVFKDKKIESSKDVLHEARKAHQIGADSAAILLAFGAVELTLRERTNFNDSKHSINQILKRLEQTNAIELSTLMDIRQLANTRNKTVHNSNESKKYTESKVDSYLSKAQQVVNALSLLN